MRSHLKFLANVASFCAAAMIALPAQAEDPLPKPFQWTDVDFTLDCSPNAGFQRVLRFLGGRHPDPNVEIPIDTALVNAISGDKVTELTLDSPQPWNGVKLTGLFAGSGIERGPAVYSLYFSNSSAEVREAFNKRGWKIPTNDKSREVVDNYAWISIHEEPDGYTSVNCTRD